MCIFQRGIVLSSHKFVKCHSVQHSIAKFDRRREWLCTFSQEIWNLGRYGYGIFEEKDLSLRRHLCYVQNDQFSVPVCCQKVQIYKKIELKPDTVPTCTIFDFPNLNGKKKRRQSTAFTSSEEQWSVVYNYNVAYYTH